MGAIARDLRHSRRVRHDRPMPAAAAPPLPFDLLWSRPRAILWLMLAAEGLALALTLALGIDDAFHFLGALSLAAQLALLGTLASMYGLRRPLARLGPPRLVLACTALFVVVSVLVAVVTAYIFEPAVALGRQAWTHLVARLVGIVIVVTALGAAAFVNYWRLQQSTLRAKQAELEALQARIRPHFLFNTLNTATALVHHRPEDAERMLLDLADLFRAALAGPREIGLAEELALVRRYLEIEQQRFGERLRVDWELPASIPDVRVPSLSIQPLVENAIRHGVERVPQGARVTISLSQTLAHVIVRISNPLVLGVGPGPVSHGVVLTAAQVRIEALTQGRGSVETGIQGEHYVATVRLPRPRPANFRD